MGGMRNMPTKAHAMLGMRCKLGEKNTYTYRKCDKHRHSIMWFVSIWLPFVSITPDKYVLFIVSIFFVFVPIDCNHFVVLFLGLQRSSYHWTKKMSTSCKNRRLIRTHTMEYDEKKKLNQSCTFSMGKTYHGSEFDFNPFFFFSFTERLNDGRILDWYCTRFSDFIYLQTLRQHITWKSTSHARWSHFSPLYIV